MAGRGCRLNPPTCWRFRRWRDSRRGRALAYPHRVDDFLTEIGKRRIAGAKGVDVGRRVGLPRQKGVDQFRNGCVLFFACHARRFYSDEKFNDVEPSSCFNRSRARSMRELTIARFMPSAAAISDSVNPLSRNSNIFCVSSGSARWRRSTVRTVLSFAGACSPSGLFRAPPPRVAGEFKQRPPALAAEVTNGVPNHRRQPCLELTLRFLVQG